MMVLDPGHYYELEQLDQSRFSRWLTKLGFNRVVLRFVKREGPGYPGNCGHHEGTNIQEVLRVLIDRVVYLNRQIRSSHNAEIIEHLRYAILCLEERAAKRHGREPLAEMYVGDPCKGRVSPQIESLETCSSCKHIGCVGTCRH